MAVNVKTYPEEGLTVNDSCGRNTVYNPEFDGSGEFPDNWRIVSPHRDITPKASVTTDGCGRKRLVLTSNGNRRLFGCWQGQTGITVGKWYKASVKVKTTGIRNPALSVLAAAGEHFLLPKGREGDAIVLERVFKHSGMRKEDADFFELYMRSADAGSAEWFEPCVIEVPEPEPRIVRAAAARFISLSRPWNYSIEDNRDAVRRKLEQAAAVNADLLVLPEVTQIIGVDKGLYGSYRDLAETVPDGPVCRILSEGAKESGINVICGLIEKRGDYMFNTAVVFNRKGDFTGQYDKNHPVFLELKDGFSSGADYPLFDLDCGRAGILICNDIWFPEMTRYYAMMGADMILMPIYGGKPGVWRSRALDNGIYFIVSAINNPSMIIDTSGVLIARTEEDDVVWADIDLNYKKLHWYGDPTLTYGLPTALHEMRNTLDNRLLEDFSKLMLSEDKYL